MSRALTVRVRVAVQLLSGSYVDLLNNAKNISDIIPENLSAGSSIFCGQWVFPSEFPSDVDWANGNNFVHLTGTYAFPDIPLVSTRLDLSLNSVKLFEQFFNSHSGYSNLNFHCFDEASFLAHAGKFIDVELFRVDGGIPAPIQKDVLHQLDDIQNELVGLRASGFDHGFNSPEII